MHYLCVNIWSITDIILTEITIAVVHFFLLHVLCLSWIFYLILSLTPATGRVWFQMINFFVCFVPFPKLLLLYSKINPPKRTSSDHITDIAWILIVLSLSRCINSWFSACAYACHVIYFLSCPVVTSFCFYPAPWRFVVIHEVCTCPKTLAKRKEDYTCEFYIRYFSHASWIDW